jgi:hypothetical protein
LEKTIKDREYELERALKGVKSLEEELSLIKEKQAGQERGF